MTLVERVERAYTACRHISREQARNFYYAFITLPPKKRAAIYAVYAFCRLCDDIADEPMALEDKLRRLADVRRELSRASSESAHPVFLALADAVSTFRIPRELLDEVVRGVEMDLTIKRYRNFEELRAYCYRVASAVGLICVEVFGYRDPAAKEYAVNLGLAMQLTNVLRDVQEDLQRDRIYIPLEELERFGYSEEELRAGVVNDAFLRVMQFQAERARGYFRSGLCLPPLLSPRSRACPAVLAAIYQRILDRIEAQNFNVFHGRVSLSGREKYLLAAKTWLKSLLPLPTQKVPSS